MRRQRRKMRHFVIWAELTTRGDFHILDFLLIDSNNDSFAYVGHDGVMRIVSNVGTDRVVHIIRLWLSCESVFSGGLKNERWLSARAGPHPIHS